MTSTGRAAPLALVASIRRLAVLAITGCFQHAILRQYAEKSRKAMD
jgi:hypothetical protein